jgi:hypothetical protein
MVTEARPVERRIAAGERLSGRPVLEPSVAHRGARVRRILQGFIPAGSRRKAHGPTVAGVRVDAGVEGAVTPFLR